MINPGRPEPGEYLDYFETYIRWVPEDDVLATLAAQPAVLQRQLAGIPADQFQVRHAPYTWTIKQVLGHCVDTERVFGYRAACFAAGDSTPLPGFDQDEFVRQTEYDAVSVEALVSEFEGLRLANCRMFERQSSETWRRGGVADGKRMTVRAAAYIMAGHVRYHLDIVARRVGNSDG